MYCKINIKGIIELKTGMHIGGSSDFSAIGAVDSPVVKDPISGLPMIPGSSLKGKMRYLLSRQYNDRPVVDHNDDGLSICRLFGSTQADENEKIMESRILISDMILLNDEKLKSMGVNNVEIKFENTINRATGVASPRQIERSIRGSQFPLDIIYSTDVEEDILDDLAMLKKAFDLLNYDYLGGSGSRGYGRLEIKDLALDVVVGEVSEEIENKLRDLYKGV